MNNTEQLSFLDAPSVANDYIWRLADGYPKSNGLKVFSCFSCGGGSTMGYKLAECDVIGNLEIDPKINEIYKANHKPKYSYCMDIRDITASTFPQDYNFINESRANKLFICGMSVPPIMIKRIVERLKEYVI